ncbi:MAG: hypothetical protein DME25_11770 [Verrucomicrobia bacterium]|nr:MAG: hypothetical protein DME25_11770 [Verrucomicrobiota bacterium]
MWAEEPVRKSHQRSAGRARFSVGGRMPGQDTQPDRFNLVADTDSQNLVGAQETARQRERGPDKLPTGVRRRDSKAYGLICPEFARSQKA